jgi:hypothetical protein
MHPKRLVLYGVLVAGLLTGLAITASAHDAGNTPSDEQVASAQKTSDLMLATLFFRAECALCHTNFPAGPTQDWVGALMLRVPTEQR